MIKYQEQGVVRAQLAGPTTGRSFPLPLKRPWSRTIIYETHVRGFTAHPSSRLAKSKRGTYAGLVLAAFSPKNSACPSHPSLLSSAQALFRSTEERG
jgi:hypothetical protein